MQTGAVTLAVLPEIDFINDIKTYNLVCTVAEKLNWSGIAHIDLRFDLQDEKVKLIEINPRYWGSLMGSLTAGVNFPYIAAVAALKGESIKSEPKAIRYVQGTLALKSLIKNVLPWNLKNRNVETSIKFILQDPLPNISYFLGKMMMNKIPNYLFVYCKILFTQMHASFPVQMPEIRIAQDL